MLHSLTPHLDEIWGIVARRLHGIEFCSMEFMEELDRLDVDLNAAYSSELPRGTLIHLDVDQVGMFHYPVVIITLKKDCWYRRGDSDPVSS